MREYHLEAACAQNCAQLVQLYVFCGLHSGKPASLLRCRMALCQFVKPKNVSMNSIPSANKQGTDSRYLCVVLVLLLGFSISFVFREMDKTNRAKKIISTWRHAGFDTAKWQKNSPKEMCAGLEKRLLGATKQEVLEILGEPDREWSEGEGLFRHYDAHVSYHLDTMRHGRPRDYRCYFWEDVDIYFSKNGQVNKIDISDHCY